MPRPLRAPRGLRPRGRPGRADDDDGADRDTRPFLYFPLRHHFEQNFHVRHRLDRYGAGRRMDFETDGPGELAAAIAEEIGRSSTTGRSTPTAPLAPPRRSPSSSDERERDAASWDAPLSRSASSASAQCVRCLGQSPTTASRSGIIHAALDAGIDLVDTADVYARGESEEMWATAEPRAAPPRAGAGGSAQRLRARAQARDVLRARRRSRRRSRLAARVRLWLWSGRSWVRAPSLTLT